MSGEQDAHSLDSLAAMLYEISIAVRRARYEELRERKREAEPGALGVRGLKVFSQGDEDGIIAEVFRRIGTESRVFVEIGAGDGLENNTLALLFDGWTGLWIEGNAELTQRISEGYPSALATRQLQLVEATATPENVNELIGGKIEREEIDLLTVDIDGNDAHLVRAIRCIRPRVIVMEYNAKFGPSIDYCMAYDESYVWRHTDRFGASLKHLELLMRGRGYSCVGCNLIGTNAFFVRDDLLEDRFAGPFTSEHHFEPARYELATLPSGHPAAYETFDKRGTD